MSLKPIITVADLEASGGSRILFEGLSFTLTESSRVGLVGTNGSGKSTLLKLLAKLADPDSGKITYQTGKRVEYVPQFVPPELVRIPLLQGMLEKVATAPQIEEWQAYAALEKLGFSSDQYDIPLGELSGGEANRALLARALVVNPDFLLLDEPTNHMDSEAIIAFEKILQEDLKIPFCIVSHDRAMLDSVTDETLFLRDRGAYHFRVPFSQAVDDLLSMDEASKHRRMDQEKEIVRIEESANRLRGWVKTNSGRAASLRNMVRRTERLQEDLTFVSRERPREIGVEGNPVKAQFLLRIPELDVTVGGDRHLFSLKNFFLSPGDRVVILGHNGAGKTTFIKTLVESFSACGTPSIKFNPQASLGYYDQELKTISNDSDMFHYLSKTTSSPTDTIRKALITAGFPYDRHSDQIAVLSGGEKARLQFLSLKLLKPTLLVLDEPTNHIDVQGIEQLEKDILSYTGACLFVSHDRRFVDNVANRFFLILDGILHEVASVQPYYDLLRNGTIKGGHNAKPLHKVVSIASSETTIASGDSEDRDIDTTSRIEQLEGILKALAPDSKDREELQSIIDELYGQLWG